jgi:hypothetical protein
MTELQDRLWILHCKNVKCLEFFDYFGRLRSSTSISCTHCGKAFQYGLYDFKRHDSVELAREPNQPNLRRLHLL